MSRRINADDLIAELEAACMPIHYEGLSGITGSTDTIAEIIDKMAEKEPAPEATGTSSTKENTLQLDDSTKERICQEIKEARVRIEEMIHMLEGGEAKPQEIKNFEEKYQQYLNGIFAEKRKERKRA